MFDKKKWAREYYIKNKDKLLRYQKQWLNNNVEYVKMRQKKYSLDNHDKIEQYRKGNAQKNIERSRQWVKNNPQRRKEYLKEYQRLHKKRLSNYSKQYHIDNCNDIRETNRRYRKRKYKVDLKYNLSRKTGGIIWKSLRGNKNNKHWLTFFDYTLNDLIKHLKKTMPNEYTWEDYMKGRLHIDHIIPISAFNFNKPEHIDFKKCWALSNLRLLPSRENKIKSNKLSKPFQPSLKINIWRG